FPDVTSLALANGLELRVAPMTQLPLVTVNVVLGGGESALSDPLAGLAVLTGSALEGGTNKRSGPELAEAFEDIGSGLSVHTGWDATTLSMTCLADRKEEALDLLAEALLEPSFPEEEVDRFKRQRLAAIRQRRMDPGSLADDSVAHFIYADPVPYHRPLAGTRESVEGVGTAEIRAHWEEYYRPGGSGVVVVGDVDVDEVAELARAVLGSWQGVPQGRGSFSAEPRSREGRIVVVDRPGAVQSEIRIGQVGAPRCSPHYFPLQVLNTVLGGAFTSRLMLNLREKQGFTYGIRSRFGFRSEAGPFIISTAVATEVTAPAVKEAMAELKGLVQVGPTEEEVTQSRDFIAGVFPLRLETTGQVAARIAEILIYGLPPHFFSTYRDEIRAVTAPRAREAGQAVLVPDEMVVVVVGDAEKIQSPLADLGLGPVEVVSPD
ncbi:MAG: M16 family metallopeptidase, partial [Longimicrobiales bacterium]